MNVTLLKNDLGKRGKEIGGGEETAGRRGEEDRIVLRELAHGGDVTRLLENNERAITLFWWFSIIAQSFHVVVNLPLCVADGCVCLFFP